MSTEKEEKNDDEDVSEADEEEYVSIKIHSFQVRSSKLHSQ